MCRRGLGGEERAYQPVVGLGIPLLDETASAILGFTDFMMISCETWTSQDEADTFASAKVGRCRDLTRTACGSLT